MSESRKQFRAAGRFWFRRRRKAAWLHSVWQTINELALEKTMAQEYKPGEIVPQSGIYTITHDPVHVDMPHEVTAIKGRRFPACRHRKGVKFQLAHPAKHLSEIDHFEEMHAPAS
jgi:hypothetical protein